MLSVGYLDGVGDRDISSWRSALQRAPILIVSGVYAALLIRSPSQLNEVIDVESERPWHLLFSAFGLLAVIAILQIAVLGRQKLMPIRDAFLVNLPSLLLACIVIRSSPLVSLVGVAVSLLLTWFVIRSETRGALVLFRPALLVWLIAYASVIASTVIWPVFFPRILGSLGVLALGLGLASIGCMILALRPLLGALVAAIALSMAVWATRLHEVALVDPAVDAAGTNATNNHPLYSSLNAWLDARGDLPDYKAAQRPYPVIIASTEGGGMAAAAHAFLALNALQMHCPNFSQHVFTLVGVSGGSMGNSLFSGSITGKGENGRLQPCRARSDNLPTDILTADHLSPVLAALFFVDMINAIVPGQPFAHDRADVLIQSISESTEQERIFFSQPHASTWSPDSAVPSLTYVATDTHRGSRFVFTPFSLEFPFAMEEFPSGAISSTKDVTIGSAAATSARFPWITPTAFIRLAEDQVRVLADGGYFENSGADTAIDFIASIKAIIKQANELSADSQLEDVDPKKCPIIVEPVFSKMVNWEGCSKHIFFGYVPISSWSGQDPGAAYEAIPTAKQSFLFDPIRTMLQTRSARGDHALYRATKEFCGIDALCVQGQTTDTGIYHQTLPFVDLKLPLGWMLAPSTVQKIAYSVARGQDCSYLAEKLGHGSPDHVAGSSDGDVSDTAPTQDQVEQSARSGNGCSADMMFELFNPTGDPKAFSIDGWGP
ncbi:hypothetical protein [Mesorhizobium sp. CO1-1-8]|uniref:hypothetical protein n=1 Tax=Mesorhizobium sp. CO1-1-8 TaxID=2876631 RepID=UPI001CD14A24|nr:hypothetical protein [Mesorhizobium sp. CO1-1-8]MBZ9772503.1 hypothetical protein [Mesorhizobium sp. CO1-1-8]